MRFLADESCDFAVVEALRAGGHDVAAVAQIARGAEDTEVIDLARSGRRVLITEDKDFGWLVFAGRVDSPGVIPIRFPASARALLAAAVLKLVREHASQLVGAFVVLRPGTARIGFGPHRETQVPGG